MLSLSSNPKQPSVSIILPTYNRAKFLPQAFQSVRAQTFQDWELIIVDDGSTDNTRELIPALSEGIGQMVSYLFQENQGAYGARNTGLAAVRGRYVAFFDSDDYWLSNHLDDCVSALENNPDVDWIYGACRIVDYATGQELAPSHFYDGSEPRPFLRLRTRKAGCLQIIDDPNAIRCMILHGLQCGLQHSVLRRCSVFNGARFQTEFRNEAEDQVFPVRALAAGRRFAYFDNIHVTYYVHDSNSSASGSDKSLEKVLRVFQPLVRGFEELRGQVSLTMREKRALNQRLSREYFWSLGYPLVKHGDYKEALRMFGKGLRFWPWSLRFWKTYSVTWFRRFLQDKHACPAQGLDATACKTGHQED